MTRLFNCALVLRDHLWQRRDLAGKLAVIRGRVEQGSHPSWLPGTGEALHTGPMVLLDIRSPLGEQLAWLRDQNPDYLLSPASNLEALAGQSLRDGVSLPALRETRCYGEMPGADLARVVGEAWGVPLHDLYSAEETGTLALQCPDTGTYHLQEEHTRVEVLDEHDRPCAVGEVGRVVVTPLHNFAMPLVRYAIGDHAEVGEACLCGRGLATLRRIMGRQRNMMRLPGGGQRWPRLPGRLWQPREAVRRLQVAQIALDRLEVRLVSSRRLSPAEGDALLAGLRDTLNWEHRLQIVYRDDLAVGTDLKFEDFVNEMPATARGAPTS